MYQINREAYKNVGGWLPNEKMDKEEALKDKALKGIVAALEFADIGSYDEPGLRVNTEIWHENKAPIAQLLEKSPDWNNEILAIVKPVEYQVSVDMYQKKQALRNMMDAVRSATSNLPEDIQENARLLSMQTREELQYGNILSKERIETDTEAEFFTEVLGFPRVQVGMKYSRLFQKLIKTWKPNIFDDTDLTDKYNRWVDTISEKKSKYLYILSINPADYLLMSYGNSWTSCQIINPSLPLRGDGYEGRYKAGTVSYMCDMSSAVSYLVPAGTSIEDIPYTPKINRQIVFLSGTVPAFFSSRMYPASDSSPFYDLFESTLKPTLEECYGVSGGGWRDGDVRVETYGGTHYDDYNCFRSICRQKQYVVDSEPRNVVKLYAGYPTHCLECGDEYSNSSSLTCGHCNGTYDDEEYYTCNSCGERVHEDNVSWLEDEPLCSDCFDDAASSCDCCGNYFYIDSLALTNGEEYVCEHCLERHYYQCQSCGEYVHGDDTLDIDGESYCRDCFDEVARSCNECGEVVHNDQCMTIDGLEYCESCYRELAETCAECGIVERHENMTEHNGKIYCLECLREIEEREEEETGTEEAPVFA